MAEALYRKYRPQIFEDVVGQEPIERTLKNAIAQDKVSHAYLLCGPRGTGKTTTARLIAKALLCEHGPTASPDGTCEDCRMIADGVHPDVYELDAASRTGVENVREEIISRVQFAPTRGTYKVYIIDEVHMLSTAAFNALLKTLEEPPAHVIFILCTTDPQKVPETIHSRCQRFDFRRISPEAMVSRLGAVCVSEGVEFEGEALDLIAHRAEGGLRNALTSLEQIIAFEDGKVTLAGAERILGSIDSNDMADIIAAIGRRDAAACFRWIAEYVETGADLVQFTRDMAEHVRNLYLMAVAGDDVELDVSETLRRELVNERKMFGEDRLSRMLCVLGDLLTELRGSTNRRLSFEIALTRLVRPDSDLTIAGLAERVEALEKGMSAAAMPVGQLSDRDGLDVAALGTGAAGQRPVASRKSVSDAPMTMAQPRRQPDQGAQTSSYAEEPLTEAQQKLQELQRERIYKQEQARQDAWNRGGAAPLGQNDSPRQSTASSGAATRVEGSVAQRPDVASQSLGGVAASRAVDRSKSNAQSSVPAAQQPPSSASGSGAMSSRLLQALQNPAALQRVWQMTLANIKKQKTAYGVLFMNTRAVLDAARGVFVVEFPRENAFAFKSVQRAEVRDALSAALQQAAGEPVVYELAQAGAPVVDVPATAPRRREAPVETAASGPSNASAPVSVSASGSDASAFGFQSQRAPIGQGVAAPVSASGVANRAETVDFRNRIPHNTATTKPVSASDSAPYDDVVPYGDDAVFDMGYDLASAPSFESPDQSFANAPAVPSRFAEDPHTRPFSQTGVPSEPDQKPSDQMAEVSDPAASDIEAMLQAGFGGGVVFKEVQ